MLSLAGSDDDDAAGGAAEDPTERIPPSLAWNVFRDAEGAEADAEGVGAGVG